ncbi:protein of unknown function [Thalassobacillus cyri]|uniref:DUF4247 domain-containing protein n=1 Tax=Thalassobacillus cyri TaxID=571932 RepID=A0A1H4BL85_9BACI|nr:DUF4247 domain-containing protein [Thalassobacillus cyri]SEA48814.1 protein of unknown function [Thalassobacillus cyri]
MKDYLVLFGFGIIIIVLFMNVFGGNDDRSRGISSSSSDPAITYDELPEEPSKESIISSLQQSEPSDAEELVSNHFPLIDTVRTDEGISRVYVTREFRIPELADLLAETLKPDEKSDYNNNKQVLVYPDHFVIMKESEEEPGVVFIELSNDQFVRNHYTPGFFNGLLTYAVLNRMLNSSNWAKNQAGRCRASNDCYGGYTMYGGYRSGDTGTFRGSTGRGGGPGAGK